MMGYEDNPLDNVLLEGTPVRDDKVRFVCVSDTHNRIPLHVDVPEGDVLLHAGDFSMFGMPAEVESFNNWLGTLPHKQKIVIAGNHELSFNKEMVEEEPTCSQFGFNVNKISAYLKEKGISHIKEGLTNCTFLEDSETSVYGIRIYGTSWQTCFCAWKSDRPAESCLDKWNMIPEGIDILMTHGPPFGHGDASGSASRVGCVELVNTIQKRVKCKYHVFGHIHEAHGISTDGLTVYINAATCNTYYLPCQRPFIFDIPLPPGVTKDDVISGQVALPSDQVETANERIDELKGKHQPIQTAENMITSVFQGGTTQSEVDDDGPIAVHPETLNPNKALEMLSVNQTFEKKEIPPENTPVYADKVRFVCVSDTHSRTPLHVNIPEGDVLLHAGDFSMVGRPEEIETFNNWLGSLPHKHKIVIAGNHELSFDEDMFKDESHLRQFGLDLQKVLEYKKEKGISHLKEVLTNCTYLEDSETSVYGIRIYGSPWQPEFGNWAFGLPRGQPCLDKWNKIPEGIDILMTHGPPIGHGDMSRSGLRGGCVELLSTIQKRIKCKYNVFGHIHEAYGMTTDGHTIYINASSCTTKYLPCQRPIIFDIPLPPGFTKDDFISGQEMTKEGEGAAAKEDMEVDTETEVKEDSSSRVLNQDYHLEPTPAPHSSSTQHFEPL